MATLTLRGGKQLQARLGADAPRAMASALFIEGERIMTRSRELVPVDMGPLRASGHVQPPDIRGARTFVKLGYGGTAAPYALYVHEGVGPAVGRPVFMPPVEAIEGWVRRNIGPPEDEVRSVAFLVARAIGRRGLRPTKFLERPFLAARAGMTGRIAATLDGWLKRAARAG